LNEKDLKDNLNALRHEVGHRDKQIKDLYRDINIHKRDADELRAKRDEATLKANKLSEEAKIFTSNRDELNGKISKLKEKRVTLIAELKNLTKDIKDHKDVRDKLNKTARGTDNLLLNIYTDDLNALLTKDIPLQDEIRIFEKLFEVGERVEVAKQADSIHKKILGSYEHVQNIKHELDQIHEEIQNIAKASQEQHEEAMRVYKDVGKLRKESDDAHKKLLEKYDAMNPLRDQIRVLRDEIKTYQDKLSPYIEDMEKVRTEREHRKLDKEITEAREKLQSSKRISFDDFRLLMEKGEIKLDEEEKPVEETKASEEKPLEEAQ
jgi:uncharacterized coiled-coil DUF342 family protein